MIKKLDVVAPPLSISHFLLHSIYERIINNKLLLPKEYASLTTLLIYVQLRTKIQITQKVEPVTLTKSITVTRSSLDKALYFMDAMVGLDQNGKVNLFIPSVHKEQVLVVLSHLLQEKALSVKPAYENASFYEKTYNSIYEKLNVEKDSQFAYYLQNVHKKSKSSYVCGFSVIGYEQYLEVKLYSKYDNFDKDECNNYRFIVTKSLLHKYPVGSYLFGVIQPNKTEVILYMDRGCTLRA